MKITRRTIMVAAAGAIALPKDAIATAAADDPWNTAAELGREISTILDDPRIRDMGLGEVIAIIKPASSGGPRVWFKSG